MSSSDDQPSVLIAEDDEGTLRLLRTLLRRRRIYSHVVRDGRDAIEAMEARCWDALILDMMMPVVTGWDVADWITRHPDRRPRSIIVVSGAEREALTSVDPSAVNAIIFKPFDINHLTNYIAGVVRQRKDRRRRRVVEEATAKV
jgi:two-component system chemotaxis response regulator CheY